jgi:hypothetical protein
MTKRHLGVNISMQVTPSGRLLPVDALTDAAWRDRFSLPNLSANSYS